MARGSLKGAIHKLVHLTSLTSYPVYTSERHIDRELDTLNREHRCNTLRKVEHRLAPLLTKESSLPSNKESAVKGTALPGWATWTFPQWFSDCSYKVC